MIITATATATTTDCCDLFHISDRFQVPISQVIYYNISNMSPLPQLPLLPLLLPHCHRLSRGWQRARFARGRHSSRGALRSGQGSKSDRREGTGQVRGAVCCAVLCCAVSVGFLVSARGSWVQFSVWECRQSVWLSLLMSLVLLL